MIATMVHDNEQYLLKSMGKIKGIDWEDSTSSGPESELYIQFAEKEVSSEDEIFFMECTTEIPTIDLE